MSRSQSISFDNIAGSSTCETNLAQEESKEHENEHEYEHEKHRFVTLVFGIHGEDMKHVIPNACVNDLAKNSQMLKAMLVGNFAESNHDEIHVELPNALSDESLQYFPFKPLGEAPSLSVLAELMQAYVYLCADDAWQAAKTAVDDNINISHAAEMGTWTCADIMALFTIWKEHHTVDFPRLFEASYNHENIDWFDELDLGCTNLTEGLTIQQRFEILTALGLSMHGNPIFQSFYFLPVTSVGPALLEDLKRDPPKVPESPEFFPANVRPSTNNLAVHDDELNLRFVDFTQSLFDWFDWSGVIMSGGAVHACLDRTIDLSVVTGSDIDMWICNYHNNKDRALGILRRCLKFFAANGAVFGLMGTAVITVVIPGFQRNVQLILSNCAKPQGVPIAFDLDYTRCFYDGTSFYATPECMMSIYSRLHTGYAILSDNRVVKSVRKGFGFQHPVFSLGEEDVQTTYHMMTIDANVVAGVHKYYYPDTSESVQYITHMMSLVFTPSFVTQDVDHLLYHIQETGETIEDSAYLFQNVQLNPPGGVFDRFIHLSNFKLASQLPRIDASYRRQIPIDPVTGRHPWTFQMPHPFMFTTNFVFLPEFHRDSDDSDDSDDIANQQVVNIFCFIPTQDPAAVLLMRFAESQPVVTQFSRSHYAGNEYIGFNARTVKGYTCIVNTRTGRTMSKTNLMEYSAKMTVVCCKATWIHHEFCALHFVISKLDLYPRSYCHNSLVCASVNQKRKRELQLEGKKTEDTTTN